MAEPAALPALLESLRSGIQPPSARVTALSSLSGEEAAALRSAWPAFPVATREALLFTTTTLAEDNIELDFANLAAIALEDPVPSVRALAVAALWESTDRRVAERLTRMVSEDPDEDVRAAAAGALRQFVVLRELEEFNAAVGDSIVEALAGIVRDPHAPTSVRGRALEALGPRALPWIDSLIMESYYDDDPTLHLGALGAMGASANEKWLEYIHEQLQSDDPAVRFEAVTACGEIAAEESTEYVAPLLEDDDAQVVFAAIDTLGEISGPEALRALTEFAAIAEGEFDEAVATAIENARFGMESRRGAANE